MEKLIEERKRRQFIFILIVFSCISHNGKVSIRKICKKTNWTKQKALAVCKMLVRKNILEEKNKKYFLKNA